MAISTLCVFHTNRRSLQHRTPPCGTSGWGTPGSLSSLNSYSIFLFIVINLLNTRAPPARWASMCVCRSAALHQAHCFPFQLVHSDVWTSPVYNHSGYKYYIVFLDDYTHYLWTFPLRQKSDVLPTIQAFIAYVHTQFSLPILALQTDNGREYDSAALRLLFSSHGIQLRLSCPYTSQQNGKASEFSARLMTIFVLC